MNEATLEAFIIQHIEAQQVPVVSFTWQGGEPLLMGTDFYRKAFEIQKKYAGKKVIDNSIQTNGTLISPEWATFFRENNILVGISIDGPEHIHNHHRRDSAAHNTWEKVMHGIRLLQDYKVEFNTLSVVNDYSSKYPLEIYRFLKSIGSHFMQFLPVAERYDESETINGLKLPAPVHGEHIPIAPFTVSPEEYGNFLIEIFDEWVRNDVGKFYVQMFDVTLANWVGEMPGLCVFAETCGEAVAIEHNGDIYSCDHFVYPDYRLGNIHQATLGDLMITDQQRKFGKDKHDTLTKQCLQCEYRFTCHGGCPKHRFGFSQAGEYGHNYLCKAYFNFFNHVHPYMQFMSDELKRKRPPANIMEWIRKQETRDKPAIQKVVIGRNDTCPCGSGKKFKNCCISKPGTAYRLG